LALARRTVPDPRTVGSQRAGAAPRLGLPTEGLLPHFVRSYAASKAALVGYCDALRAEVAGAGVGVTLVAPGYIATDHAASSVGGDGAADGNAKKGMDATELAALIADAVAAGTPQLVPAPAYARGAMLLRACWPAAFFKLMQAKGGS